MLTKDQRSATDGSDIQCVDKYKFNWWKGRSDTPLFQDQMSGGLFLDGTKWWKSSPGESRIHHIVLDSRKPRKYGTATY